MVPLIFVVVLEFVLEHTLGNEIFCKTWHQLLTLEVKPFVRSENKSKENWEISYVLSMPSFKRENALSFDQGLEKFVYMGYEIGTLH